MGWSNQLRGDSGSVDAVRSSAPRRARGVALPLFLAGHLALLGFGIIVFANTWFDPLVYATGGLISDTLLVNLVNVAVLIGGVVLGLGRLRLTDIGLRPADLPRALAVLVLLWLATQVVAAGLAWVSAGSLIPNPLWARRGVPGVLGLLLAQLIGNALFEEAGYRGFLLRQFELRLSWITDRRGRLAVAAGLSLIFFTIMHLPLRLSSGLGGTDLILVLLIALALGTLLTLLYLRTDNLLLVVGVHALINAPTLLISSPVSNEIVEALAVLLLVFWPRLDPILAQMMPGPDSLPVRWLGRPNERVAEVTK